MLLCETGFTEVVAITEGDYNPERKQLKSVRNRLTDIENKLLVTKGGSGGGVN